MAHQISCTDKNYAVDFINNDTSIIVVATECGEYWFGIGYYSNIAQAKRGAVKKMSKFGLKLNEKQLNAFTKF